MSKRGAVTDAGTGVAGRETRSRDHLPQGRRPLGHGRRPPGEGEPGGPDPAEPAEPRPVELYAAVQEQVAPAIEAGRYATADEAVKAMNKAASDAARKLGFPADEDGVTGPHAVGAKGPPPAWWVRRPPHGRWSKFHIRAIRS